MFNQQSLNSALDLYANVDSLSSGMTRYSLQNSPKAEEVSSRMDPADPHFSVFEWSKQDYRPAGYKTLNEEIIAYFERNSLYGDEGTGTSVATTPSSPTGTDFMSFVPSTPSSPSQPHDKNWLDKEDRLADLKDLLHRIGQGITCDQQLAIQLAVVAKEVILDTQCRLT
jgi:hypothetical protein